MSMMGKTFHDSLKYFTNMSELSTGEVNWEESQNNIMTELRHLLDIIYACMYSPVHGFLYVTKVYFSLTNLTKSFLWSSKKHSTYIETAMKNNL
uniref:Uncharacterized protein n=1 Tax=Meleagris gallopavo TaxID=9103 RepID=A0A803XYY8_MELGA